MGFIDLASGLRDALLFVVQDLLDALDSLFVVVDLSVHHLDLLLLDIEFLVRTHLNISHLKQGVAVVVLAVFLLIHQPFYLLDLLAKV